jgi:hypothetical protein
VTRDARQMEIPTPARVICDGCGGEISEHGWVRLNGKTYHVINCFSSGLRRLEFVKQALEVSLSPTMPPMIAYKAGETTVAAIVASRRRAKRQ